MAGPTPVRFAHPAGAEVVRRGWGGGRTRPGRAAAGRCARRSPG